MMLQAAQGLRGTVYDLDTGQRVPKVIELNTDEGYLKAYSVVAQDDAHPEKEVIRKGPAGDLLWYVAYGRFKFVPREGSSPGGKSAVGAPVCTLCDSRLTLPGDDLCPRCRAAERRQPNRFLVERITTPLLDRKCEKCSRLAVWSVADEVEVSPEAGGGVLYERGMTVGRRYYCNRCYRPARLLDPRGEVVKDFRYAGPDTLKTLT